MASIFSSYRGSTSDTNEKQFEWQLLVGQQWLPIDNDHVIETHYCHPGAQGITINTIQGKVFIDFDKFQTMNAALQVQRLSFLSQGEAEDVGWYFRDDQLWREYGSQSSSRIASSISSRDIEHQFTLDRQGTFSFTVGSTSYALDFTTMKQRNCTTGMHRNVRRRPKFTCNTGRISSTPVFPTASSKPTNGRYKWEYMGEEGEWVEYQAHICAFDSAAVEAQYQLNPQSQLQFRIDSYSYTLDLSSMCQVDNNIGTRRAVRRTADNGSRQNRSSGTPPQWQFLDIDGKWKEYSKNKSSISSQDIELVYQQNPTGIITFTTNLFSYELNFSAMTQRNLSTNTTRSVQRLNQ
ncbi:uncharacterized protein si:ch211-244b2.3 [Labrus mixtus]|uniref:uncharacterized protein si:ch211-244b2.3 n=1 Tax=Labrus mixtus TaxID=508554 RepID=UPI0029C03F00|nr:uncharacterized protein si:ch211-244b2.3 [Labrus mixtus]